MKKKEKDSTGKRPLPPANKNRTKRLFWLGIFFFACVWMFILGILVGRGTAPVQFDIEALQKELAELKEAVVQKERSLFKIDSQPEKHKVDMSFYEKLKEAKEDDQTQDVPKAEKPAREAKPVTKKAPSGPQVKSEKISTASAKRPEEKKEAAETNTVPAQKLTIQVASVKDPVVAERMVATFKNRWYPAYKTVADIPGKGTWYRIRIGSFSDRDEARETLERLKKQNVEAILVRY